MAAIRDPQSEIRDRWRWVAAEGGRGQQPPNPTYIYIPASMVYSTRILSRYTNLLQDILLTPHLQLLGTAPSLLGL